MVFNLAFERVKVPRMGILKARKSPPCVPEPTRAPENFSSFLFWKDKLRGLLKSPNLWRCTKECSLLSYSPGACRLQLFHFKCEFYRSGKLKDRQVHLAKHLWCLVPLTACVLPYSHPHSEPPCGCARLSCPHPSDFHPPPSVLKIISLLKSLLLIHPPKEHQDITCGKPLLSELMDQWSPPVCPAST